MKDRARSGPAHDAEAPVYVLAQNKEFRVPVEEKSEAVQAGAPGAVPQGLPSESPVPRSDLYPSKDEGRMENLPNRSIQTLAEPGVRTHGAASVSDAAYWAGHTVGIVFIALALVLIVAGRGPRKRDALSGLWMQKQQAIKVQSKAGQ